ncbi:hypothetical protein SAMN04488072_101311 [Lentibacillus halodurans]|uniref:Uncharacterized protein n=1 Tax=Lentibacillus halodurans TaxID=237679 RepID=A0A1I0VBL8_9BACI|nr:hypothetical protein SAMN04488072_101311 [Lentibacillus halodurans]
MSYIIIKDSISGRIAGAADGHFSKIIGNDSKKIKLIPIN